MTFDQLKPGKWYAIGVEVMRAMDDAPRMQYDEIVQYQGGKCFTNDDGDTVDGFWDAGLQLMVAVDAADDYAQQG